MRIIQKRTLAFVALLLGGAAVEASACPRGCAVCTTSGDFCVTGNCLINGCTIYPCIGPTPQ
jgi:hypothetical protein